MYSNIFYYALLFKTVGNFLFLHPLVWPFLKPFKKKIYNALSQHNPPPKKNQDESL